MMTMVSDTERADTMVIFLLIENRKRRRLEMKREIKSMEPKYLKESLDLVEQVFTAYADAEEYGSV